MIQFDRMKVGSPPAGFSFARTGQGKEGEWRIVADPTANAGLALEQTSTDPTSYRFPLAILDSQSAKNVKAQIRFKAISG